MGQYNAYFDGGGGRGLTSQTFGTVIQRLIPAKRDRYTRLNKMLYTCAGTVHTLTVMAPLASTTLSAAAAGGATTVVLSRDPGSYAANAVLDGKPVPSVADNLIATNDFIVLELNDGTQLVRKVTVSGLTMTITALPTAGAIAAGGKVWFYGITSDTNPNTGIAHDAFTVAANATNTYADLNGEGLVVSSNKFEPLIINSSNGTAAGTIEQASWSWTTR